MNTHPLAAIAEIESERLARVRPLTGGEELKDQLTLVDLRTADCIAGKSVQLVTRQEALELEARQRQAKLWALQNERAKDNLMDTYQRLFTHRNLHCICRPTSPARLVVIK